MEESRTAIYVVLGVACAVGLFLWYRQEWRAARRTSISPTGQGTNPDPHTPPTDLVALFAGTRPGERTLEIVPVAAVSLPTGKLVACDPLVCPDTDAFAREVPPGIYPVDVAVMRKGDDARVAALRVRFGDAAPVRWELATQPGQDLAALGEGETFGYGVDAGVGCVMDETTARRLVEVMDGVENYYDDVLAAELGDRLWGDHRPDKERAGNCVIAYSGWGDGIYSSFWALDASGAPVWFVTDFEVTA